MDKRAKQTLNLNGLRLKDLYLKNLSPKEVKALDIKVVVADPEWQKIRSSLVGAWKTNSSKNVKILKDYVGKMDDPFKVRRVLNYLTGSAFRMGIINSDEIENLRSAVRSKWNKMTS